MLRAARLRKAESLGFRPEDASALLRSARGSAGLRGGPAITPSVCRKSRDVEKICPLPGAISMYNLLHVLCLGLDSPCEGGMRLVGKGRERGLCTGDPLIDDYYFYLLVV